MSKQIKLPPFPASPSSVYSSEGLSTSSTVPGVLSRENSESGSCLFSPSKLKAAGNWDVRIRQVDGSVEHKLEVWSWTTVPELKAKYADVSGVPAAQQRLFLSTRELRKNSTLKEYGVSSGSVLTLVPNTHLGDIQCYTESCPTALVRALTEARRAIKKGVRPKLTLEGCGGTYFVRSVSQHTVAVFKPEDEEPFTPNNPKRFLGAMYSPGLKPGVRSGEAAVREVVAYMLDRDGFAGVPPTALVEMTETTGSTKIGSFQRYEIYDCLASDISCRVFPVENVHRIGIMDIRLMNLDRNEANILVRKASSTSPLAGTPNTRKAKIQASDDLELVPIDHGYCLPDSLAVSQDDWVWSSWFQARVPFSAYCRQYIKLIDIEADIKVLMRFNIRDACIRTYRISVLVLKHGTGLDLSLAQIASFMLQPSEGTRSALEVTVDQVQRMVRARVSDIKAVGRVEDIKAVRRQTSCFAPSADQMHSSSLDGKSSPIEPSSPCSFSDVDQPRTPRIKRSWSFPFALSQMDAHEDAIDLTDDLDDYLFFEYFPSYLNQALSSHVRVSAACSPAHPSSPTYSPRTPSSSSPCTPSKNKSLSDFLV